MPDTFVLHGQGKRRTKLLSALNKSGARNLAFDIVQCGSGFKSEAGIGKLEAYEK